jgi:hypothetical protein
MSALFWLYPNGFVSECVFCFDATQMGCSCGISILVLLVHYLIVHGVVSLKSMDCFDVDFICCFVMIQLLLFLRLAEWVDEAFILASFLIFLP